MERRDTVPVEYVALRNHPVYRELVSLGEPGIPLILAELEREPDVSWFTVLTAITGADPVPAAAAGRVDDMARAWLDWGRQRPDGSPTVGGQANSVRTRTSSTALRKP